MLAILNRGVTGLLLLSSSASANCLPELRLKADQVRCQVDADCVWVGDACRSCGQHIVANKKFKEQIELQDQKAREEIGCVLDCEACSRSRWRVVCRNSRCTIR